MEMEGLKRIKIPGTEYACFLSLRKVVKLILPMSEASIHEQPRNLL